MSFLDDAIDALADADAEFFGAAKAFYTPPGGGGAFPCSVLRNDGVQQLGEFGEVAGVVTEIELVDSPDFVARGGGRVQAFGATFELSKRVEHGGGSSRWVVSYV